MKILIIVALLGSTLTAPADMILYKQNITTTKTGAGMASKAKITGWAILDAQAGDIVFVNLYQSRGRFNVRTLEDYTLDYVSSTYGKRSMVVAIPGSGVGAMIAKGVNTTVDIGVPQTYSVPKALTVSGSDLFEESNEVYLEEYKGTLAYDKGSTENANIPPATLAETVNGVRDFLTSRGYAEE